MQTQPIPDHVVAARPWANVRDIGKPSDLTDEECGSAEMLVSYEELSPGRRFIHWYAHFRPDAEELAALNAGGTVELALIGAAPMPFSLAIWPPAVTAAAEVAAPGVTPQAGDIGLTVIPGLVGWFIRAGQWASLDGAPYQHAFLVTDDEGGTIEAMPGKRGVRPNHVRNYAAARTCYIRVPQSDEDRWEVARQGLALLGRRYSYMQYPALGLLAVSEWRAKVTGKPKEELRPEWLLRYIADSGRLICSQADDEAFVQARKVRPTVRELFDDHRAPGDVSPGDLYRMGRRNGWILS